MLMARIVLECDDSREEHRLTLFDDVLSAIIKDTNSDSMTEKLLSLPTIRVSVKKNVHVVTPAKMA